MQTNLYLCVRLRCPKSENLARSVLHLRSVQKHRLTKHINDFGEGLVLIVKLENVDTLQAFCESVDGDSCVLPFTQRDHVSGFLL